MRPRASSRSVVTRPPSSTRMVFAPLTLDTETLRPPPPPAAEVAQPNPPDDAGHLRGSLFINGQRRDFDPLEQYQAAMRELMGPVADFGFFPLKN
jgi:hypothetical protein